MNINGSIVTISLTGIAFFSSVAAAETGENNLSAYLTLTSDYVYRGISWSSSDPALQIGVDYANKNGWFAGVWASTVKNIEKDTQDKGYEIDYYLGYGKQLDRNWAATATILRSTYRAHFHGTEYDYSEVSAGISFANRLSAELAYSPKSYDTDNESWNVEFSGQHTLPYRLTLAAAVGRFKLSDLDQGAYTYWHIGMSRTFDWLTVDLRFHDSSLQDTAIFPQMNSDSRLVLSFSAGI